MIVFLIFLANFLILENVVCVAQELDINTNNFSQPVFNAIQTLTNTKPAAFPAMGLSLVNPSARKAATDLYNMQMAAIYVLGNAKQSHTSKFLIPYLNYSTPDYHVEDVFHDGAPPDDLKVLRKHWPAFSALLDIPGSEHDLSEYVLNEKNPSNVRISALITLRYLDEQQCKNIGQILVNEAVEKNEKEYILEIISGSIPFRGIRY